MASAPHSTVHQPQMKSKSRYKGTNNGNSNLYNGRTDRHGNNRRNHGIQRRRRLVTDSFWKNFTYKRTVFKSGGGFTQVFFFSNNLNHVERTMVEACQRLRVEDFRIAPCNGGGYEGTATIKHEGLGQ